MKYSFVFFFLLLVNQIKAQQKNALSKDGLLLSPLALTEPNSTIDIGYIKAIDKQNKIFINAGVLLPFNFYKGELPFNKGGYRMLCQLRRYNKSNNFFYGVETKYRYVSFDNISKTFINTAINDTVYLKNPTAKANIWAGAILMGVQYDLSKNKKWGLEASIGLGARFKKIRYKETTSTFIPYTKYYFRESIVPAKNESMGTVHVPCTIRVIRFLN